VFPEIWAGRVLCVRQRIDVALRPAPCLMGINANQSRWTRMQDAVDIFSMHYNEKREANVLQKKTKRTTHRKHPRAPGAKLRGASANEASVATRDAWRAMKEAVRSSRAQPVAAARATGKAMRNVARSGARQTSAAAETIARAADEVLISAMSEATKAAQAAREAAKEVERSVTRALKAIKDALRKRARVAVNDVTRKRPSAALKKVPRKGPRARRK
jgi:hypothetical protein